ncbi:MAG: DUF1599 domain-containing protein [Bacteroidia bacterium]|nr:DUF1599 domain-containing protein [Bacteroidia bacterium]
MQQDTLQSYWSIIQQCKDTFLIKMKDYGTAWRNMRPSSITDQIFIKAKRIKTIEETGVALVNESMEDAYMGIVNYCLMALMQLELGNDERMELPADEVVERYDRWAKATYDLMLKKNHDYGEAWRDLRLSSITDLILMKIARIKQIEDNKGQTIISEGVEANYMDILNYSVFALILLRGE